jgi:TRAP-type C4-dicarboxylate transport system permease small subunit
MLVVIVFFGWAHTLSIGGHVRVDTIISRISHRAQAIIGLGTSSLALVIFGLMAWRSALKAIASSQGYEVIDVIKIPVYPFQFLVSVGSFSLCLELTVQIFHFLTRLRKGS